LLCEKTIENCDKSIVVPGMMNNERWDGRYGVNCMAKMRQTMLRPMYCRTMIDGRREIW
jgi:hypothetical protein